MKTLRDLMNHKMEVVRTVPTFTEGVSLRSIGTFHGCRVAAAATLCVRVVGAVGGEAAALLAGVPVGGIVV